MELETARLFLNDLELASRSLVMQGALHLLFLVTPQDVGVKPDYRHFYSLVCLIWLKVVIFIGDEFLYPL